MADSVLQPSSLADLQTIFSGNTYVAIDFYADWCGPCKVISPVFAKLGKKHGIAGTLAFAKVNVDNAKDIAQKYQISAMPTFMFFKDGKQVGVNGQPMIRGADAKSLNAAAEKLGGLAKKKVEGS
ncbi:Thioredoxin-like protein 1 [Recurvomyces mirabilis]|uniref:Thioredoxin-like protein 1 n=1 Tax=Recurvomyces mirabilis TaxID=574656 RepID=A0AAE0TP41_9PEZI|nr:Thioredoxin-like protein 1 [Recurvomyces mirabilis]KAK5159745.1 hypothetical protein LTS14_001850 [Recurvomyces mirabilis]